MYINLFKKTIVKLTLISSTNLTNITYFVHLLRNAYKKLISILYYFSLQKNKIQRIDSPLFYKGS
jgi:predicted translin family RNA/ssDNA-binding protein